LHAFGDGLDVLLGLEPEHRYGRGPGVGGGGGGGRRRAGGLRRGRGRGQVLRRRRRRLAGGGRRAVHDGRRQVARVAGLRVRQESGQRGQQRRRQPGVDGQRQARAGHPAQRTGHRGVHVVVQAQSGRLHLLLSAPLGPAVLEPHL